MSMQAGSGWRGGRARLPHSGWEDKRLVGECLKGEQPAWDALVEKYKNLVYSIALRYGAKPDDAADIFQTVWVTVYNELGKLKKQGSIRSWLITITRRQCYHWKQGQLREFGRRPRGDDELALETAGAVDPIAIDELERHQLVREAIESLTERCREIVKLLFFSEPPLKYREIAERSGLAIGSIGFTRERCLKQLRRALLSFGVA